MPTFQVLVPGYSEKWFDLRQRTTATMLMSVGAHASVLQIYAVLNIIHSQSHWVCFGPVDFTSHRFATPVGECMSATFIAEISQRDLIVPMITSTRFWSSLSYSASPRPASSSSTKHLRRPRHVPQRRKTQASGASSAL